MKVLHVTLTCTTDLHTGGQSQGSFLDFLKMRDGKPYLPATHVKGVMRSEAERMLRSTKDIPCAITGMAGGSDHAMVLCPELRERGEFRCGICSLFGHPDIAGGGMFREGKIRVMNFLLPDKIVGIQSERTHVSIDRDTGRAIDGALYSMNTVPRGTVFCGDIIIREPLTDEEERILTGSLHAMADYGLGRERSRGLGAMRCAFTAKEMTAAEYLGGKL
jgi:CRISPR/Cas system CSM-associated protein Csm3 (group 7 of RAMP superfamily)